jgi:hypothetical protein
VVITIRPRPDTPGVELATWCDDENAPARCVLAHTGVATQRWLQLADVVVCQPQRSRAAAERAISVALTTLPGCTVVAVEWGQRCTVVVRGFGELTFHTGDDGPAARVGAICCYAWAVSSASSVDGSKVFSRS